MKTALVILAGLVAEPQSQWLSGVEIVETFSGKTMAGAYSSGLVFTEFYAKDGSTDYRETGLTVRGRWSVVNGLFCNFYDELPGGCFRISRESENCYGIYVAASSEEEARNPVLAERWLARGSIADRPSTCKADLTS